MCKLEINITDKKKNAAAFLIGVLLLTAGTLSLLYWGNRKQIWFIDEIYTYESANGFEQDYPTARPDQWMTGEDVDAFFAADMDTLSLNEIAARLYTDHVPLYFWLFRMVSLFFFKGSGTIWIGLSINLFFYLIFLGLVYRLSLWLTQNPLLSGVATLLTCVVNRLIVQQITFVRMYMMLLWAELMVLLGGLWILQKIKQNKMSAGVLLYLFLVSVAGFLTHYYFWIFYAAEAVVFCLWLLIRAVRKGRKNFRSSMEFQYVLAWFSDLAISLFIAVQLFPYCRWNLRIDNAYRAKRSLFIFSTKKLEQIAWGYECLSTFLFGDFLPVAAGLLIIFGCIIGGMIILYRKKEYQKLAGLCLTVLTAQLYQLIVCFTLPAAWYERYLWGSTTMMMLCMAWGAILLLQACLSKIADKRMRRISQWTIGVVLSVCILAAEILIIDDGKGIRYLFFEEKDVDQLQENSDIPWIVYGVLDIYSFYDWRIPEQICFLTWTDSEEDQAAVQAMQSESFILYVYDDHYSDALAFLEQALGRKPEAEYLTKSTNFNVYLVK